MEFQCLYICFYVGAVHSSPYMEGLHIKTMCHAKEPRSYLEDQGQTLSLTVYIQSLCPDSTLLFMAGY